MELDNFKSQLKRHLIYPLESDPLWNEFIDAVFSACPDAFLVYTQIHDLPEYLDDGTTAFQTLQRKFYTTSTDPSKIKYDFKGGSRHNLVEAVELNGEVPDISYKSMTFSYIPVEYLTTVSGRPHYDTGLNVTGTGSVHFDGTTAVCSVIDGILSYEGSPASDTTFNFELSLPYDPLSPGERQIRVNPDIPDSTRIAYESIPVGSDIVIV